MVWGKDKSNRRWEFNCQLTIDHQSKTNIWPFNLSNFDPQALASVIDLDSLMLGTFGVWILIITCFSFTHSMSIGHATQDLQKLSSTKDKAGTHLNFHILFPHCILSIIASICKNDKRLDLFYTIPRCCSNSINKIFQCGFLRIWNLAVCMCLEELLGTASVFQGWNNFLDDFWSFLFTTLTRRQKFFSNTFIRAEVQKVFSLT